jgi:hypothetical protein
MDKLLSIVQAHPWLIVPLSSPEIYLIFRARRSLRGGSKRGKASKAARPAKAKLPRSAKLIMLGFVGLFVLVGWAYTK